MPTFSLKKNLTISCSWKLAKFCLLIVICLLIIVVPKAQASTDPVSATASATATIAATGGSTSDTESPTPPILISPTDGTVTGDNKVEFVWRQSTDPNGNTVTYTLYLNGVATYLGVSGTGNSSGLGYSAHLDGTEVKLKPTTPLADGQYNWRVVASDPSDNSSTSTTWSFTIDTVAPIIGLTDVDIYHDLLYNSSEPELFQDLNFDISGPKDVYLTVESEPWSTLTIKFRNISGDLVSQVSFPLDQSGIGYPYAHLAPGVYLVSISSFDQGGNTTALPDFQLTVTQAVIKIPLPDIPGVEYLPPSYNIPYSPISIPSLPATIAKIQTSLSLTIVTYLLLAVSLLIMLILILNRKYNIIFIDNQGQSLSNLKVYHSIPNKKSTLSTVFITTSDHGKLYIQGLTRYSTLTIKTENRTYILSLCAKRKVYTIVLDA